MVPIERTPVRQFSETKQMAEAMVLFLSRREYHNEFLR